MTVGDSGHQDAITSDLELAEYISNSLRASGKKLDHNTVSDYLSVRDFGVEPLHTKTGTELINLFVDTSAGAAQSEQTMTVRVQARDDSLETITSRVCNWGYRITHISRTNRSVNQTPVLEFKCIQSANLFAQFQAIDAHIGDTIKLFYGCILLQNLSHESDVKFSSLASQWHSSFDVDKKTAEKRFKDVYRQFKSNGGLPGTQWEIKEKGGIQVQTDVSEEFTN